jgi:hypothetical protein
MQAPELIKYVKNPHLLEEKHVSELQALVNDFPYFQSGHLLLSLASKKWNASAYQQSLKKTAIIAANRAHLFNLINGIENTVLVDDTPEKSETFISKNKTEKIQEANVADVSQEVEILKAVENSTEIDTAMEKSTPIEEVIEKEIGKQIVAARVERELEKVQESIFSQPSKEKPESFGDWLTFLKKNNGQSYSEIKEKVREDKIKKAEENKTEKPASQTPSNDNSRQQKNKALIDKIIEKNPGHIRTREEQKFFSPESKAKESLLDTEHLVTETLARIYALQGNVNKAIRAYQILSLKFPQKSAYFATLIEKLKNNQ